ncbi:MAG: flagellar biosynthetic protein FliO [Firmicutes bacterium HGW-Firmicutes-15]|nr:MAG: flagellar biosynthetic protein FliO [Firmicutes bacterium HGW-Firmicutes-15]
MNPFHKKYLMVLVVLLLALTLFLTGTALGVDNIQDLNNALNQEQPKVESNNLWFSFLKLILVLMVIIAAAWSIIRLFAKQVSTKMQGSWLHVVDEVMLGQNRGLVLCEVSGKIYALGVTDGQINLLFEVDNPKLLEEISTGDYTINEKKELPLMNSINSWFNRKIKMEKGTSSPKNFHLLMQEQNKRIKDVSFPSVRNRGSNAKRSGEDE